MLVNDMFEILMKQIYFPPYNFFSCVFLGITSRSSRGARTISLGTVEIVENHKKIYVFFFFNRTWLSTDEEYCIWTIRNIALFLSLSLLLLSFFVFVFHNIQRCIARYKWIIIRTELLQIYIPQDKVHFWPGSCHVRHTFLQISWSWRARPLPLSLVCAFH